MYANTIAPQKAQICTQAAVNKIGMMWDLHRRLRKTRARTSLLQIIAAWKRWTRFQHMWKEMRTASRQARHHLIAGLVQQTNAAADKGDLRGVYQVANQLSPKRRYEAVRIRSPDGSLHSTSNSTILFGYVRQAFSRSAGFVHNANRSIAVAKLDRTCRQT